MLMSRELISFWVKPETYLSQGDYEGYAGEGKNGTSSSYGKSRELLSRCCWPRIVPALRAERTQKRQTVTPVSRDYCAKQLNCIRFGAS